VVGANGFEPSTSWSRTSGQNHISRCPGVTYWISEAFFGTPENAVRSQIWIAASAYVRVKKRLHLSASLYEILQILSLTMFEKIPLDQLLAQTMTDEIQRVSDNQLILFT
jgi:hypothetical protein